VDRAALDAALKHGVDCGGWCPSDRRDEVGKIPACYPVKELASGGFGERTLENVKDSNATIVIFFAQLHEGSEFTLRCCREQECPVELIDAEKISAERAADLIDAFVRREKIAALNVAGPRESEWRQGYDYVFRTLDLFLSKRGDLAAS